MTESLVSAAPGGLGFVQRFVNTRDIDLGTDALLDPDAAAAWAAAEGIAGLEGDPTELIALRESLRDALLSNHDERTVPPPTAALLQDAITRSGAQLTIGDGGLTLVPPARGQAAVFGRVAQQVSASLADGTWWRLKACAYDSCHWAFYDRSRSRTGRWCLMGLCGNRAKQARWRETQSSR